MSVDVLREVFTLSQSRGVARNVLTVLADAAHPDGVTWLPILPSKNGDPAKCLTHRANASKRAVIDAIAELAALGEIEVRKAQRGQARINVYRVVLGTVGWMEVDYADLPFQLEQPFGSPGAKDAPSLKEVTGSGLGADPVTTGCSSRDDWVQNPCSDEPPQSGTTTGVEATFAAPQPSIEPSLQPAAVPELRNVPVEAGGSDFLTGGTAAAEPPLTDREITTAVMTLRDADIGSPPIVIPIVHGLSRSVFERVAETVRRRPGGVGLLIKLVRIAQAERTAMLSAQLAHDLGASARPYLAAPWAIDVIKRNEPERYVRIMAGLPSYPADALRDALHGADGLDDLVALFHRVRAGDEHADRVGTPEQERLREVDRQASDLDVPLADVDWQIDAWDDVDPVERETLHERAEYVRTETETARAEAA